jgi:predicted nucleic acid-binding protein
MGGAFMIVVDSNIIGYLYLNSDRSSQAERALRKDPEWAAPLLWCSEFRNVLTLYIRKRLLSLEAAQEIMDEALSLMLDREYEVVSSQVLNLAAKSTCSAYDCEFVALAQDLDVSLVTVDKHVLDQFPNIAVSLDHYLISHDQ